MGQLARVWKQATRPAEAPSATEPLTIDQIPSAILGVPNEEIREGDPVVILLACT